MVVTMSNNLSELLTPEEVARILKVSYHSALDIIKRNFAYIKVGKQYRVSKEEVEKLFASKGKKYL